MPEGDTIFRAARTLHLALGGRPVTRFETVLPKLSRVDDDTPLAGRVVTQVSSRGKNLLMEFSGGLMLRTHMRMNGSWHIYRPGEKWRRARGDMRIVVETPEYVAVAFNVSVAEFVKPGGEQRHADLGRIGPDLLAPELQVNEAITRIQQRPSSPIADALLNQRVVSGIGNVYKSEVLFLCRIHPDTPVSSLSQPQLEQILSTARRLMLMNAKAGADRGIVTYVGFRRTTRRADPSQRLWVYGRKAKPCRNCGTPIERRVQGVHARSTYWCPLCQPRV